MVDGAISVVVWNCFRRKPGSPEQQALRERMSSLDPDLAFLTETDKGMLTMAEVSSDPHWNSRRETERKTVVFSKFGWAASEEKPYDPSVASRMVTGRAVVAGASVNCIGVCVPYDGARHRRDEPLPKWQAHLDFLQNLRTTISGLGGDRPLIVAGDFNQTLPGSRAPKVVFEALQLAVGPDMTCATSGVRNNNGQGIIDHVFVSRHFSVRRVQCLPRTAPDGKILSDHDGVAVDLEFAS